MNIAKWRDIVQRFAGRGVYPHELAFLLESPLRHLILSPQKLANTLHLTADAHVLEIGPGPGYFSSEVARRIPGGQLVLFDIQPEMLNKSRIKLQRAGLKNLAVEGNAVFLPFGPRVFDVVFLVTVLGEITQPGECLGCIGRILRPGGVLSLTEMRGDPDALSASDLIRLAEPRGFQFLEQHSFFGGFTLNLRKVEGTVG